MVQHADKERSDGALNSATNSLMLSSLLTPSVLLLVLYRGSRSYDALRHILHGSERPTVGVAPTRLNSAV
jgi:hypothetical protein